MPTPTDELPTPRSTAASSCRILVWCKACHHNRFADLANLIAKGRGDISLMRIKCRCTHCRSLLTDWVVSGSYQRPDQR
jgi:hypothetical protein